MPSDSPAQATKPKITVSSDECTLTQSNLEAQLLIQQEISTLVFLATGITFTLAVYWIGGTYGFVHGIAAAGNNQR